MNTTTPVRSDAVLLTGATGFLGGFLCAELLRQTDATIHCLVRGRSLDGARRRLVHHLMSCGVAESARVDVIHGDLSKPRLGLTMIEYERLGETVGAIYHCGALTNQAASFDQLVPVNVRGANELLRLARFRRAKAFHHISTLGVFNYSRACGMPEVIEAMRPTEACAGPDRLPSNEGRRRAGGIPRRQSRPGHDRDPPLDAAYFERSFRYLIGRGIIPPPGGTRLPRRHAVSLSGGSLPPPGLT